MKLKKYLLDGESKTYEAKKNKAIYVLITLFLPICVIGLFLIIHDLDIILHKRLSFTAKQDFIAGMFISFFWFCLMVYLVALNSKLIITNKRVVIKKALSGKLFFIPFENISSVEDLHKSKKIAGSNISFAYGLAFILRNGQVIKSTVNLNKKGLVRSKEILRDNGVSVLIDYISYKGKYEKYEMSGSNAYKEYTLKTTYLYKIIICLSVLATVAFYLISSTDININYGRQEDVLITGKVIEKIILPYRDNGSNKIMIQDTFNENVSIYDLDPSLFENISEGTKFEVSAKRGCVGILYNITYKYDK